MKKLYFFSSLLFLFFVGYLVFVIQKQNSFLNSASSKQQVQKNNEINPNQVKIYPFSNQEIEPLAVFCSSKVPCELDEIIRLDSRITLINFWASWCLPCVEEMPELLEFAKTNQNLIKLVLLNVEEDVKIGEDFLSKVPNKDVAFRFNDHNQKFAEYFGVVKYPETLFVNQRGNIIKKIEGAQNWTKSQFLDFIKEAQKQ